MMENKNRHVKEYLDYYLSLSMPPQYAVLLRGKWGCGKSWFIKQYVESTTKNKYLYVSLNGITSYSEIEDDFFQQLHPMLASKGMKLVGKVLKGVIKTTIKVDIDNDNNEDGSVTSTIPDISLPDYLKNLQDRILIFDDLERCSIVVSNILGYINQFVEHNGLKVIIIANEEEIILHDEINKIKDNSKTYLSIKEKIIGKSLDIQTDFDSSLSEFINQLKNEYVISLLKSKSKILELLFNVAGYNNLRHLRMSLLDFERFSEFIPESAKAKVEIIDDIFNLFFSVSFELKKGSLIEDEIKSLFTIDIITKEEREPQTNLDKIREKYPVFGKYYYPLSPSHLTLFFKNGTVDKTSVKEFVESSYYFQNENIPNWVKLWHWFDLNDDEYLIVLKNTYDEFEACTIEDKYILLHITGTLLSLSKRKLFSKSKKEIIQIAKKNVVNLKNHGKLILDKYEEFPPTSYAGLGFNGNDISEYTALLAYMRKYIAEFEAENYHKLATELIAKMDVSIDEFIECIGWNNSSKNLYYDVPILSYINREDFVSKLINLPNKSKKTLGWVFEQRYLYPEFNKQLQPELIWLKALCKELIKVKNELKGKPSGYLIEFTFLNSIKNSIKKLEKKYDS